jgi:hypothetical protein
VNGHRTPGRREVLDAVRRGQVRRLALDPTQKLAFRDPDGRLALDIVRHLTGARVAAVGPGEPTEAFPLTESMFQAVAARLGHNVGIKRSRGLIRRLVAAHVIELTSSYRQPYRNAAGGSGFRVALYKVTVAPALIRKRAVGRRPLVKQRVRRRWWQHDLFGEPDGRPPTNLTLAQARRMRSLDELGQAF